jgi:hypothetical protein
MVPPDGREILFAGAGFLYGATTFCRGLLQWRSESPPYNHKIELRFSLIAGFVLVIGCSAYLASLTLFR